MNFMESRIKALLDDRQWLTKQWARGELVTFPEVTEQQIISLFFREQRAYQQRVRERHIELELQKRYNEYIEQFYKILNNNKLNQSEKFERIKLLTI